MSACKDCFHFDVCMDYTALEESAFAQNFDQSDKCCEHYIPRKDVISRPCTLDVIKTVSNECMQDESIIPQGALHFAMDMILELTEGESQK